MATNYSLINFEAKNFRSLKKVSIEISSNKPTVICGENNIGKTNLLRAMNLFFNHDQKDLFVPREDIPHHIYEGSGGAGAKTVLTGIFIDTKGDKFKIAITFKQDGSRTIKINNNEDESYEDILSQFNYLFIESNNVDLPVLISSLLESDALLALDKKRSKQSKPLEKLKEFIELSQKAIKDIEKEINICFKNLVDFEGVLLNKEIKVNFVEFDLLREAVKGMTEITLFDGNDHSIASKGSGAQRAVFLSLMQYISSTSKTNTIWGIDEPEVFLQPKLQERVSIFLKNICNENNQPIILTTHSQHFIPLNDIETCYLFEGKQEAKQYQRKPGVVFYEMDTSPIKNVSASQKIKLIKEHLGISGNDGWEVLPENIVVEGEEDKKYIKTLMEMCKLPTPNIIWAGGATKISGYLQYYNSFAKELDFKPEYHCIYDHDEEGKRQYDKLNQNKLKNIEVHKFYIPRFDGMDSQQNSKVRWEIEDFLPSELIIDAVNLLLRKYGYKKIIKSQSDARTMAANNKKRILVYVNECIASRNSDKEPIDFTCEGRKKELCMKVCDITKQSPRKYELEKVQVDFLTSLSK